MAFRVFFFSSLAVSASESAAQEFFVSGWVPALAL